MSMTPVLSLDNSLATEVLRQTTTKNAVSSTFLTDIKITNNNGQKITLTEEAIADIFRTFPEIKQKYEKYVKKEGGGYSRQQFWKLFVNSSFYNRALSDKMNNQIFKDDLFSSATTNDKTTDKNDMSWLLDSTETSTNLDNIFEPPGMANYMSCSVIETGLSRKKASGNSNRDLLANINRHSMAILASQYKNSVDLNEIEQELEKKTNKNNKHKMQENSANNQFEKDQTRKEKDKQQNIIQISEIDRYICGAAIDNNPNYKVNNGIEEESPEKRRKLHEGFSHLCANYQPSTEINQIINFEQATQVTNKLFEEQYYDNQKNHSKINQNSISNANNMNTGNQLISTEVENKLCSAHSATQELLKNFWSCFPVNTKEKFTKLKKAEQSLHDYDVRVLSELHNMENGRMREAIPQEIIADLKLQLETAYTKFRRFSDSYKQYSYGAT